jgi:hypothetical protein
MIQVTPAKVNTRFADFRKDFDPTSPMRKLGDHAGNHPIPKLAHGAGGNRNCVNKQLSSRLQPAYK